MVQLKDLRNGMEVLVRTDFGSGPLVKANVTGIYYDIKNGRPGIDYKRQGAEYENWCYLHQVEGIVA